MTSPYRTRKRELVVTQSGFEVQWGLNFGFQEGTEIKHSFVKQFNEVLKKNRVRAALQYIYRRAFSSLSTTCNVKLKWISKKAKETQHCF